MIKKLLPAATLALTAVVAFYAHELCFEDTLLGGYLPFVSMTLAPVISFFAGRLSSDL